LADLICKAALGRQGIRDPFEQHHRRPLAEHLADWEASLLADGAKPKHVRQTVACARKVLDGCKFVFAADLSASAVQQFLARLRGGGGRIPPLVGPGEEPYPGREWAAALGVKPAAVPPRARRPRREAAGRGKARRYPRATLEVLHALRSRGRSVKT